MKRSRQITPGDTRSPMLRLLQDCRAGDTGNIEPNYEQQFRTLFKAERLGYVDARGRLTEKGEAFIASGCRP